MQFSMFMPALYEQGLKLITFKLLCQAFNLEHSLSCDSLIMILQLSTQCQQLFEILFNLSKIVGIHLGITGYLLPFLPLFPTAFLTTACLVYHLSAAYVKHFLEYIYVFSQIHRVGQIVQQNSGNIKAADQIGQRLVETGGVLLSQAVSHQVSSALGSLTSVFEMGTGGSSPPLSPDHI